MPKAILDANGQPSPAFHHQRLMGRSADELIGICKGVLADGLLDPNEATFLLRWMEANARFVDEWPFNHIYARFACALEDGVIDNSEERELLGLLADFTGGALTSNNENTSTELACDIPVPDIVCADRVFCLTGKFAIGPRKILAQQLVERGAQMADRVNSTVDYLVVGAVGSRDWLFSTHGTKLQDAAGIKAKGGRTCVVAERHVVRLLA